MSLLSDVVAGLKTAIQLEERVTRMAASVSEVARDLRDIDKRLVRVETVIEIGLSNRPSAASAPTLMASVMPETRQD